MALPDFLHIGAAKAGSSWIYEILRSHPQIFVPTAKDLCFFDHQYDLGVDWYEAHFADAGEKVKGEVSHDYFLEEKYIWRIKKLIPEAKITVCLREPVERILSRYKYAITTEVSPSTTFEDYVGNSVAVSESNYLENLKPVFDAFPSENIKVFFFEEITEAPEQFSRDLFEFLGVDAAFQSPALQTVVRGARHARSPLVGRLAWRTAKWLRGKGKANWVGAIKRSSTFNRLMYAPRTETLSGIEDQANALRARFARDMPALETLIGRPVPKAWGYASQP